MTKAVQGLQRLTKDSFLLVLYYKNCMKYAEYMGNNQDQLYTLLIIVDTIANLCYNGNK